MSCSSMAYAQMISKVIHLSTKHSHCHHLISRAIFVTLWEHEIWESKLSTTLTRNGMTRMCPVSNVCAKICYNHFAAIKNCTVKVSRLYLLQRHSATRGWGLVLLSVTENKHCDD